MAKLNEQQQEIKKIIEKSLVRQLKNDQRELKILSEGDLQSCVYYHLRKKLKKMPHWHILNKLYMGEKEEEKKVPDIAIAYLNYDGETVYPKFLIELKETIGPLSGNSKKGYKKDIQKLKELIKKHKNKIVKTYFILAVLPIPGRKGTSKSPIMHSTKDIEEAIQENKLNSKIQTIVINTQYYRRNLVNPSFMKKVKLLRKFRE